MNRTLRSFKSVAIVAVVAAIAAPAASLAAGTLFVKNDNTGFGIANPTSKVHVFGDGSAGKAQILVQETAASSQQKLLELKHAGYPLFFLTNTAAGGSSWQFSNVGFFTASLVGTGGAEFAILNDGRVKMGPGPSVNFDLAPNGNLLIAGTLTQGSSRSIKQGFEPVDGLDILDRVVALPLSEWSYKSDPSDVRHIGPMAEDFREAFVLGEDAEHLAPGDAAGVALAAIQGLNRKLEEKSQRVEALEAELAELKSLIQIMAAQ